MKKILGLFSLLFAMFCLVAMEGAYASSSTVISPTAKVISVEQLPTEGVTTFQGYGSGFHFRLQLELEHVTHLQVGLDDRSGVNGTMPASRYTVVNLSSTGRNSPNSAKRFTQFGEYTEGELYVPNYKPEGKKKVFVDIFYQIPKGVAGGAYSTTYRIKLRNDPPKLCQEPQIVLTCMMGEGYKPNDEMMYCPAHCKGSQSSGDNNSVDTGGAITLTTTPATQRELSSNTVAKLDTLLFAGDKEFKLEKISLKRHDYPVYRGVDKVWLENEQGERVTNEVQLNENGVADLLVLQEYQKQNSKISLTIMAKISKNKENQTLGFRLEHIESTAQNIDRSGYKSYSYAVEKYSVPPTISITGSGNGDNYQYVPFQKYEIAKFLLGANESSIRLKSIVFHNKGTLSLGSLLDKLEVRLDDQLLGEVNYLTGNGEDKLQLFFGNEDVVDLSPNETKILTLNASFFTPQEFGQTLQLIIDDPSKVQAHTLDTLFRVEAVLPEGQGNVYVINKKD